MALFHSARYKGSVSLLTIVRPFFFRHQDQMGSAYNFFNRHMEPPPATSGGAGSEWRLTSVKPAA